MAKKTLALMLIFLLAVAICPAWAEDEEEEAYEPELHETNILDAVDGLGSARYTLVIPERGPWDEKDPRHIALGVLAARLVQLDGSLGDPADADFAMDVDACKDLGEGVTPYVVFRRDNVLHIYINGVLTDSIELNTFYTDIVLTRNKRNTPSVRYTARDGVTRLYPLTEDSVVLFTGDYVKLKFSSMLNGMPVAIGAACHAELLASDANILLHNSGLVEDSTYAPLGFDMVGIFSESDEKENEYIDSGFWMTGPRPVRGIYCMHCKTDYRSADAALHNTPQACTNPNCRYGGVWYDCVKSGNLSKAAHEKDPECSLGVCWACGDCPHHLPKETAEP
ncbi:MAG: hypothetical protein RR482_06750 [Clostridia bacterium]